MFKFKSNQFSEFADLGDLTHFTLNELRPLVKKFKREEKVEGQIHYVKWYNESYVFVMEYDLHGKFRRILSEEWLDPKMDFITKLRNYLNSY
jgi:hypothetical protein